MIWDSRRYTAISHLLSANWDERIKKVNMIGGAPSAWASTNEFNFGKDLVLDFLGCANLLWSTHTIDQADLGEIVRDIVPVVRAGFRGQRIPSEDGDQVVAVDISGSLNLPADTKVFGVKLSSLKSGEVSSGTKVFTLAGKPQQSGNRLISAGVTGKGNNPLPKAV